MVSERMRQLAHTTLLAGHQNQTPQAGLIRQRLEKSIGSNIHE